MPTSRSADSPIAVTTGDPAGIGPEVTVKALSRFKKPVLLLGDAAFYRSVARRSRVGLDFADVSDPAEKPSKGRIACFPEKKLPVRFALGRSQNRLTAYAVRSIERAVGLAMTGHVRAVVTPPIHKAGLKKAGFRMPGHTEFLAELSGTREFEMMLVGGPLRVVVVTRHEAIRNVPSLITKKRVEEAILTTVAALRRSFGIRSPRLVVCGLNPHAGEEGTIGREEIRVIEPAVRSARKKTDAVITGPLSPDSLFVDAYAGKYDAEICMYHDQGLIPLKMISRGAGVNVTLGLPFVRTSPDHGTGYDIAPAFKADPGSMFEALNLASTLSDHRAEYDRSRSRRY
jgi:4-hydroxythreonine-4-phosphate dehydrogenase